MKRFCAILLTLVMVMMLGACGAKEEIKTAAPATTEETAEAPTEVTEQAAEATELTTEPELIHPIVANHYQCAQDSDNQFVYEVSWNEILLDDADAAKYPELQQSFDELNAKFWDETFTNRNNFAIDYTTAKEDRIDFNPSRTDLNRVDFVRSDSNITSVLKTYDWFGGGAHGGYGYGTYNYDSKTGKQITLDKIIGDEQGFYDVLEKRLKEDYPEVEYYDNDNIIQNYTLNDLDPDEQKYKFSWTLGYRSLTVYFQQYEVAPYAAGIQIIDLPFDEYSNLFIDVDTLKLAPACYASALPETWDDNGHKTRPYSVRYNGRMYTFSFIEKDDDEAVLKVADEGSDRGMELEGRLATTNEAEEVTGPFDGMNCSQRVTTGRAFVDPMKFELEYLNKSTGETVVTEYSAEGFIN